MWKIVCWIMRLAWVGWRWAGRGERPRSGPASVAMGTWCGVWAPSLLSPCDGTHGCERGWAMGGCGKTPVDHAASLSGVALGRVKGWEAAGSTGWCDHGACDARLGCLSLVCALPSREWCQGGRERRRQGGWTGTPRPSNHRPGQRESRGRGGRDRDEKIASPA